MNTQLHADVQDDGTSIRLRTPETFRFEEALAYLTRSPAEILFQVQNNHVLRLVSLSSERVLLQVSGWEPGWLDISFPAGVVPTTDVRLEAAGFVREWFHLGANLAPFYRLAERDDILRPLVQQFYGLRLIGVPDLFEALCWAVIGQQINLTFAYILKARFIQGFGEHETTSGETYWLFPTPERIAQLHPTQLQALQMTGHKSEYLIGIAQEMATGRLSKQDLLALGDFEAAKRVLTNIRGIGDWTANYVAMRCLRDSSAYPVADVGLQNAVKLCLGMDRKPTTAELLELGQAWSGWEAYATFYLWRSLQGLSA